MTEALCGTQFEVTGIDGKAIAVDCSGQVVGAPGFQKVIANKGMPKSKSPGQFGHLIVEFDTRWPAQLSAAQQQHIKAAAL
eukprot:EW704957.1.p2 GENE.EW704957.1~~EW704957.1.p2  ORF type:complete len:81 (+),score=28.86 EW704957.1:155-397(+)